MDLTVRTMGIMGPLGGTMRTMTKTKRTIGETLNNNRNNGNKWWNNEEQ